MHIEMDSEMRGRVEEEGAEPLVFCPEVKWETFAEPNIIHAY
jgi:hypothetical protein